MCYYNIFTELILKINGINECMPVKNAKIKAYVE
jgi:hypothetical protein